MTPIHELLNRIVWDPGFGNAHFVIGYYDRVFDRVVRISFERIRLEPGRHFSFEAVGKDGVARMIPFHRVREVSRNGQLIWRREAPFP